MKIFQGRVVEFNSGDVSGLGTICGIATHGEPIIGKNIIIKVLVSNVDKNIYPFTHIVMFEQFLKEFNICKNRYYIEGYNSYPIFAVIDHNPYPKNTIEHYCWKEGREDSIMEE